MTLLALIGNGLEDPELVTKLLDVEKIPRRPGYKPAQPDGLVLTGCQFEELNWVVNPRDLMNARDKVAERQHTTRIQAKFQKVQSKIYMAQRGCRFPQKIHFRELTFSNFETVSCTERNLG